jgi:hypothetical protein
MGTESTKAIMSDETIADIAIPDTPLVREITEYIRGAEDELLFNHSRRVFLFGALQARRRGLEQNWNCSTPGRCFTIWALPSATEPRSCVSRWTAPMRHASSCCNEGSIRPTPTRCGWPSLCTPPPAYPSFSAPKLPVTAGVETDVLGIARDDLSPEALAAVTTAHPRPDFKKRILAAFNDGMKHRPRSTFGTINADVLEYFDPTFVRDNFVDIIRNSTWPE